jgi:hypothetical protein
MTEKDGRVRKRRGQKRIKENKRDGECKRSKEDRGEWKNGGGQRSEKWMSIRKGSGREEDERGWMSQRNVKEVRRGRRIRTEADIMVIGRFKEINEKWKSIKVNGRG